MEQTQKPLLNPLQILQDLRRSAIGITEFRILHAAIGHLVGCRTSTVDYVISTEVK